MDRVAVVANLKAEIRLPTMDFGILWSVITSVKLVVSNKNKEDEINIYGLFMDKIDRARKKGLADIS